MSKRGRQPVQVNPDTMREDADALRVLIRQAHEATKDCRQVIRQMESVRIDLLSSAAYALANGINDAVEEGLNNYRDAITDAIANAEDAIYQRFDIVAGILLGEEGERDRDTIEDQARLVRRVLEGDDPSELTEAENRRMDRIAQRARNLAENPLQKGRT